jgi:hypothetical protein
MDRVRALSLGLTVAVVVGLTVLSKSEHVQRLGSFLGTFKKVSFSQPFSGQKTLDTELEFNAGELNVFPLSGAQLFQLDALYKLHRVQPVVEFSDAEHAKLHVSLKKHRRMLISARSIWNLGLGTQTAHNVIITSGASRQTLDFSGVSVSHLAVSSGATKLSLFFSRPNPMMMDAFSLEAGASDCRLVGLSNAHARSMNISLSAGNVLLDFSGEPSANCNVLVDGGTLRGRLVIPPKLNCRIRFAEAVIASVRGDEFVKRSRGEYVSQNFDPQKPVLDILLKWGPSSLEITTRR